MEAVCSSFIFGNHFTKSVMSPLSACHNVNYIRCFTHVLNAICYKLTPFIFFSNASTDQTTRPIFTHDGSNDAVSRKEVPFGVLVDTTCRLGSYPLKPLILGRDRDFHYKPFPIYLRKYSTYRYQL
jgi:hypothetical protein